MAIRATSASMVSVVPPAAGSTLAFKDLAREESIAVTLEASRNVMPCRARMRWKFLATSRSMPGRMRSKNSTTVTWAAEPAPHRAELEPDDAGADDQEPAGNFFERQRAGRRDDAFLVDVDAACSRATSDPVAMTIAFVSSVVVLPSSAFTSTLPGGDDPSAAAMAVDLVLLQQEVDTLDVAVDALVLELEHGGEIERWACRCRCRCPYLAKECAASS